MGLSFGADIRKWIKWNGGAAMNPHATVIPGEKKTDLGCNNITLSIVKSRK